MAQQSVTPSPAPSATVSGPQLAPPSTAPTSDRSPVDVSDLFTDAEIRQCSEFIKRHGVAALDPVQTCVWNSDHQLYYFRPISPSKNPRSNIRNGNLQKHRNEPVDVGEYLQLAGHLCLGSGNPGGAPGDAPGAPDWTPPPYKGFDVLNPDGAGAGDPNGGDPSSWHALPRSARPLPICYGVDWTRNHISPENNLGLRHPNDGTALPWLARYPNGGVHLFHPVVNPGVRKRPVEGLVHRFWKHTQQH